MLVHTEQILLHFYMYVVTGTVCKSSAEDAKWKMEVIYIFVPASPDDASNSNRLNFMQSVVAQKNVCTCNRTFLLNQACHMRKLSMQHVSTSWPRNMSPGV